MKTFYSTDQARHLPEKELHNGVFVPAAETVSRLDAMLMAVGDVTPAIDHGMGPLLRVHDPAYLAFLECAHTDWRAAGRAGDAIGYVFPVVGRRDVDLTRIDARLGRYSYDVGTPIAAGTWAGAYGGAQAAVSAAENVLAGAPTAFALCRPPGHHAGQDYFGGYCYLNNAAIAAECAKAAGAVRVAILDVDYHHGNGTQDLFYARGDVLVVSLHADPATDYPFYWGHSDERGEGHGQGINLNLPLARGTDWPAYRAALSKALSAIADFNADLLIVSYGADTFVDDPISHFAIKTDEYTHMARDIAALGRPTVIVMEGGYAVGALADNLKGFLNGFSHEGQTVSSRI